MRRGELYGYRDVVTGEGTPSGPQATQDRVTQLGRACAGEQISPGTASQIGMSRQGRRHAHTGRTDWLRDVILGGQDGLVNILGIVLGVISGGEIGPCCWRLVLQRLSPNRSRWEQLGSPRPPQIVISSRPNALSRKRLFVTIRTLSAVK